MKKYIFQVFKYGFLFWMGSIVLASLIYYLTGDNESYYRDYELCSIHQKMDLVQNYQGQANTLFFGTSKSYRQIDPAVIDENLEGARTLNVGMKNLFPFRLFDFIEESTRESSQLKIIVLELTALGRVGDNYDSPPNVNAINPSRYKLAIKYPAQNPMSFIRSSFYWTGYSKLFLYKYSGFGIAKRIQHALNISKPNSSSDCEGIDYSKARGFYALDQQIMDQANNWKPLQRKGKRFQEQVNQNKDLLLEWYDHGQESFTATSSQQNDYFKSLEDLIGNLQNKADKLVFLVPPRVPRWDINSLQGQKQALENAGYCVLDFSSPQKYPELYTAEYSFDLAHLNSKGAKHYSKLIANELKKKCPEGKN